MDEECQATVNRVNEEDVESDKQIVLSFSTEVILVFFDAPSSFSPQRTVPLLCHSEQRK